MSSELESLGFEILARWHRSEAVIFIELSNTLSQAHFTNSGLICEWNPDESKMSLGSGADRYTFDLSSVRITDVLPRERIAELHRTGEISESVSMDFADGDELRLTGPLEIQG